MTALSGIWSSRRLGWGMLLLNLLAVKSKVRVLGGRFSEQPDDGGEVQSQMTLRSIQQSLEAATPPHGRKISGA